MRREVETSTNTSLFRVRSLPVRVRPSLPVGTISSRNPQDPCTNYDITDRLGLVSLFLYFPHSFISLF